MNIKIDWKKYIGVRQLFGLELVCLMRLSIVVTKNVYQIKCSRGTNMRQKMLCCRETLYLNNINRNKSDNGINGVQLRKGVVLPHLPTYFCFNIS